MIETLRFPDDPFTFKELEEMNEKRDRLTLQTQFDGAVKMGTVIKKGTVQEDAGIPEQLFEIVKNAP